MAALPYVQLYVADYLADTAHLSTLENGAYLLLIFNYWQRGESFKAKDQQSLNRRLASVARMSNDEFETIKESLAEFFEISETEWKHLRIERDLESVNAKSEKAKAAGKASAASKANARSTPVEQTFNHTDTDTDTDKEVNTLVGSKLPTCPQTEILRLFSEKLPELPQPRIWNGVREKNLSSRWRWVIDDLAKKGKPSDKQAGIDFFGRMFSYIRSSDFLMGRGPGSWGACSLGWIVKPENFAKIIEGQYENKSEKNGG